VRRCVHLRKKAAKVKFQKEMALAICRMENGCISMTHLRWHPPSGRWSYNKRWRWVSTRFCFIIYLNKSKLDFALIQRPEWIFFIYKSWSQLVTVPISYLYLIIWLKKKQKINWIFYIYKKKVIITICTKKKMLFNFGWLVRIPN